MARSSGAGQHAKGDTLDSVEAVRGSAQGDILAGDSGANRVHGAAGDDKLYGLGDADTFVFTPGTGDDTVADFQGGNGILDQLDLTAFDISSDFNTFKSNDVSQSGSDTVLNLGSGDTVTLANTSQSTLVSDDVLL